VDCADREFDEISFTVCEVDTAATPPRLFLKHPSGTVYGHFGALPGDVKFAMNAGMYHDDRSPVGHYVENGQQQMRVVPNAGPGNFGLLPNGILCIKDRRANVIETRAFLAAKPDCKYATQSGPMLVIDGALHPRFLPDSTSRYIRNGVGTSDDGKRAVFVISDNAVTFYEFAEFFRDTLGTPNALFLDGNVSRLYAPDLNRVDSGRRMGPIVGVTVPSSQ
jgi:uncharacterized protein YigE (DUF2233 family)